jgi:hypothetical protein
MEEEEKEDEENGNGLNADGGAPASTNDPKKTSNEATLNGNGENQASREEEEVDENALKLDAELLT